jgi:hypothetical protein
MSFSSSSSLIGAVITRTYEIATEDAELRKQPSGVDGGWSRGAHLLSSTPSLVESRRGSHYEVRKKAMIVVAGSERKMGESWERWRLTVVRGGGSS